MPAQRLAPGFASPRYFNESQSAQRQLGFIFVNEVGGATIVQDATALVEMLAAARWDGALNGESPGAVWRDDGGQAEVGGALIQGGASLAEILSVTGAAASGWAETFGALALMISAPSEAVGEVVAGPQAALESISAVLADADLAGDGLVAIATSAALTQEQLAAGLAAAGVPTGWISLAEGALPALIERLAASGAVAPIGA